MKSIQITLTGLTPLLMNNISGANLDQTTRKSIKHYDHKDEADKAAYWLPNKKGLCIPDRCLYGCIRVAASYFKVKGRSMKPVISGSIRIEPNDIPLGTSKYELDVQSVVIQRNRVLKARPRLDNWSISFKIIYNEDYISDPKIIKSILEEAGIKVGLLDFRPAKGGHYGTFKITKFVPD